MLCVMHTGSSWRELPERFGPWSTASSRYYCWCQEGLWQRILQVSYGGAARKSRPGRGQSPGRLPALTTQGGWPSRKQFVERIGNQPELDNGNGGDQKDLPLHDRHPSGNAQVIGTGPRPVRPLWRTLYPWVVRVGARGKLDARLPHASSFYVLPHRGTTLTA